MNILASAIKTLQSNYIEIITASLCITVMATYFDTEKTAKRFLVHYVLMILVVAVSYMIFFPLNIGYGATVLLTLGHIVVCYYYHRDWLYSSYVATAALSFMQPIISTKAFIMYILGLEFIEYASFHQIANVFILILVRIAVSKKIIFLDYHLRRSLKYMTMYQVILLLIFNVLLYYIRIKTDYGTAIFTSMAFVVLIFMYYILAGKVHNVELEAREQELKYNHLKENQQIINTNYKEITKVKHYFVGLMKGMLYYINADDFEALKSYFYDRVLSESNKILKQSTAYQVIKQITDVTTQTAILDLEENCNDKGIPIQFVVDEAVTEFPLKPLDIFNVIHYFTENAMYVCRENTNPEIIFTIKRIPGGVTLSVSATFNENPGRVQNPQPLEIRDRFTELRELAKSYKAMLTIDNGDGHFLQQMVMTGLEKVRYADKTIKPIGNRYDGAL